MILTVVRQYLNPKHLPTIPILQENQWNRVLRSLTINIIGSEYVSSLISEIHHQVPTAQLCTLLCDYYSCTSWCGLADKLQKLGKAQFPRKEWIIILILHVYSWIIRLWYYMYIHLIKYIVIHSIESVVYQNEW